MNSILDLSKLIASISFIFGTLLLVIHLFFGLEKIITIGLFYVLGALIINTLLLISLIINLIISSKKREIYLKSIGIILINLPIAIGYFFIVIETL